jgi:hypothetical protein
MKALAFIIVVVQLWFVTDLTFGTAPNLGAISYRYQERVATLDAWHKHPSPATEAAYQEESRRAADYVMHRRLVRSGTLLVFFLALDIACLYGWKNFRKNYGYKSPAA